MKKTLVITDKTYQLSYGDKGSVDIISLMGDHTHANYRNVDTRNQLMRRISHFIENFPKTLYLHTSINPVEILRYGMFFYVGKYYQLIIIFNKYSNDQKYEKILFDLSNSYDKIFTSLLFKKDQKVAVQGIGRVMPSCYFAVLTFKKSLARLAHFIKSFSKRENRKTLTNHSLKEENFVFVESSKNGLLFSNRLASEKANRSNSILFTPNNDIAKGAYEKFDHINFTGDFNKSIDFLKAIRNTIRLWIYPLKKKELTNTKEFRLFYLFTLMQIGFCSLAYYSCYNHFNFYNPRLIFSTSIVNPFTRSYMLLGKKNNRKGILIQHGIMHTFEFEKHITQDYFILWGQYNKERLIDAGFSSKNIFVSGSPKYETTEVKKTLKIHPEENIKVIYFAPNTGGAYVSYDEALEMLQSVLKACSSIKGIKLSIKFHPRDKSGLFKGLPPETLKFDSPEHLMNTHHIIITSTSTTGIEACCMDKDLIILEPQTPELTGFYKAFNAALVVKKKPEQLKEALDKLISNENNIQSELQNGRRELIDSMFNGMKPGSVERMAESLQKIIAIEN